MYTPWAGMAPYWAPPPPAPSPFYRPPASAYMATQQAPSGFQAPPGFSAPPGYGYGAPSYHVAPQPPQQQHAWTPMHGGSFDTSSLARNFSTMTLSPPGTGEWYADSGAGSHMVNHAGILFTSHPPQSSHPSSIIVGNGNLLPITSVGSHSFSTTRRHLVLSNVLVSPNIIKNLISVRRFTIDNNCSIEFDPFGLSVKDLQTRSVIARCNNTGNLYPFFPPAPSSTTALTAAASSTTLWHRRLGHVGHELCPRLLVPMLFHVISSAMILMFAMSVSLAAMCASLLACQISVHRTLLI